MNYWEFGDYLGIGAGAHAKISFPGRIVRQMRLKHPAAYLDAVERDLPVVEERTIAAADAAFEFMMNALRLTRGFAVPLFEERTGLPLARVRRELDEAERKGLIESDHSHVAPTPAGRRFLNDLLQIFLPEPPRATRAGR